jgi:hypothetical protein
MARRRSLKSLKNEKPYWYCLAERFGTVRSLVQTGIRVSYVTDPRDVAGIWRYLGNPSFRHEYSYLFISTSNGAMTDIYAVKLPKKEKSAGGSILDVDNDAFEGEVDHICYGWATRSATKAMQEKGTCGTNNPVLPGSPGCI